MNCSSLDKRCSANLDLIHTEDVIDNNFFPDRYVKHFHHHESGSCSALDEAKWLLYSNVVFKRNWKWLLAVNG